METELKPLLKGIGSFVLPNLRSTHQLSGSISAKHCYNLFFRHFGHLQPFLEAGTPKVLFELGPGSSLGVGLAAILCGVDEYFALDLQKHRDVERDKMVLEQLAGLIESRAALSKNNEAGDLLFPPFVQRNEMDKYGTIGKERLSTQYIDLIKTDLEDDSSGHVRFIAPYDQDQKGLENRSDWIISHSVLEHVDQLEEIYALMSKWLKPGGFMTHLIDFSSHSLTKSWNGHWALGDRTWSMVRGKRPYLINRAPRSRHLELMEKNGFVVKKELKFSRTDGYGQNRLAKLYRNMPDEDVTTTMTFIVAKKK